MNWHFGDDSPADKKHGLFKNNACRRHPRYRPNGDCGISRRESRGYSTRTCSVKSEHRADDVGLRNGRCWQIVLQKSFSHDERNFLGPLMRFARGNVRDHIAYQKNGHGASYRRYRALQRRRRPKINFREIFGVVRFSTFATVSATSGSTADIGGGPVRANWRHPGTISEYA